MHSVADRRTDGQQATASSRSYCVAVRSAKNWCRNTGRPNMTNFAVTTDRTSTAIMTTSAHVEAQGTTLDTL